MSSVDELEDDLSELFSKPSEGKPRAAHPPRRKQEGYMSLFVSRIRGRAARATCLVQPARPAHLLQHTTILLPGTLGTQLV
jgi:hypothetical protein